MTEMKCEVCGRYINLMDEQAWLLTMEPYNYPFRGIKEGEDGPVPMRRVMCVECGANIQKQTKSVIKFMSEMLKEDHKNEN